MQEMFVASQVRGEDTAECFFRMVMRKPYIYKTCLSPPCASVCKSPICYRWTILIASVRLVCRRFTQSTPVLKWMINVWSRILNFPLNKQISYNCKKRDVFFCIGLFEHNGYKQTISLDHHLTSLKFNVRVRLFGIFHWTFKLNLNWIVFKV